MDYGWRPVIWRQNQELIRQTRILSRELGRERLNGVFGEDGAVALESWLPVFAALKLND